MNYTNGFMVHHATFMASRAYLVSDIESQQSAEGRDKNAFEYANVVFKKYLPEELIPGFDGTLDVNHPGVVKFSVFTGVYVKFSQLFSSGFVGGKESVQFRSESFLGREPSRVEVYNQICLAISSVTLGSCDNQATLDDNGG